MKYKKKLNKKTYEKTKYETFIIHYKETLIMKLHNAFSVVGYSWSQIRTKSKLEVLKDMC